MNAGKSGLEAEMVRAFGVLRSMWSTKNLPAEKEQDTHFLKYQAKETCIEHSFERETAVARKWVAGAETAIKQEQEDMRKIDIVGLTTREPEKTFQEILAEIGDSLSGLASSNDQEDAEGEGDDDTGLGKLSKDDKLGCVMAAIYTIVQQHM